MEPSYNWNVDCDEFIPRSVYRPTAVVVPVHHQEPHHVKCGDTPISATVNNKTDNVSTLHGA